MKKINLIWIVGIFILALPFVNTAVLTTSQINNLSNSIILANYNDQDCTTDNSTFANTGTTTNTVWSSSGKLGGSCTYGLDGSTTARTVFPNIGAYNNTNNLTVLCWINSTYQTRGAIASIYQTGSVLDGWWELYTSNTPLTIFGEHYASGSSVRGDYSYSGNWEQISYIINGTSKSIAIARNGTVNGSTNMSADSAIFPNSEAINFGQSARSLGNGYNEQYKGGLDECVIFNRSLTSDELNYTWWTVDHGTHITKNLVSTPNNITLTALDNFDGSTIYNFSAILTTATSNITFTTGSGTINVSNMTNGFYNITFISNQTGGYFNRTYFNINVAGTALEAQLWQSEINVNASDFVIGTQITSLGIKTNGSSSINLSNSTGWANLRLKAGTYNLTINSTPYNNLTYLFSITNREKVYLTGNFSNSAQLTINATNLFSGVKIYDFDIQLINNGSSFVSGNINKSTTTGSIQFSLANGTYNLSFISLNYTLSSALITINVTASFLPNYTFVIYTSNSFNISIWDEIKGKPTPFNLTQSTPVTFEFSSGIYSTNFSTTNSSFYLDLVSPSDYRLSYVTDKYRQRQYYFTIINGTHQVLDLYLLSTTNGSLTTFTITDQNSNVITNYTLKAQRYYTFSNTYETVAMAKTDAQGQALIDLQLYNAFYKFIIQDNNGKIWLDTIPSTVFSSTYSLSINTQGDVLSEIKSRNSANLPITFSNTTNSFTFTYSSLTGLSSAQTCLEAYEVTLKSGSSRICNSCSTSGSATLVCDASSSINNNLTVIANAYTYQIIGDNSTAILLDSKSIISTKVKNVAKDIWGISGVLMAFFITLSMVMIGIWSPLVSLMFGTIGFAGSYFMGLISLGASGLSWIIGIIILTGIIMYRSRA